MAEMKISQARIASAHSLLNSIIAGAGMTLHDIENSELELLRHAIVGIASDCSMQLVRELTDLIDKVSDIAIANRDKPKKIGAAISPRFRLYFFFDTKEEAGEFFEKLYPGAYFTGHSEDMTLCYKTRDESFDIKNTEAVIQKV